MLIYFLIVALFLIHLFINLIQIRLSKSGSDHYIYLGQILSIKRNKHRFITGNDTIIEDKNFNFPQLYQWILSYFPESFIIKYCKYINIVIITFSLFTFFIFLIIIFPKLNIRIDFFKFFLITSLTYILTPFSFFSWNAKNIGLSA